MPRIRPRPVLTDSLLGHPAPRRTGARRGAGVSHRARDPEANRRRPQPHRGAHASHRPFRPGRAGRRSVPRRARHRDRRRPGTRHHLRVAHVASRTAGRAHHRRDGGTRPRTRRGRVHGLHPLLSSRRCGAQSERAVCRGAGAVDRHRHGRIRVAGAARYEAMRRETSVFTDRSPCWTAGRRTSTGVSRERSS